ncbi:NUDIX domain-containing protein [Vibrio sp. M260118]|uniref:NUDIX domain-containing protein n=1 Tax=Vibrio sp. M260118 TaxID=3020896 RepID=UPI002F4219D8
MNYDNRIIVFLLAGLSLLFSSLATASESSIKGAACIIRSGDQIVLVKEILTGKLSLPAGYIGKGESPKLAAQRETWEETGLVVTVKDELMSDGKSVYFDCVSDSDIVSFQFNNTYDGYELPIWFAPHYGIEVSSAMLVKPAGVPSDSYRYPNQLSILTELLPRATDQSVLFVGNLIEAAPVLQQIELNWMTQLQHLFMKLPSGVNQIFEPVLMAGNWLGESTLLLVLLPVLYWRFGSQFSYKVFFAITITSLLSLVAQQGFASPRPHVYLPALELAKSYGFSLPNLPIAIWSCVGMLVLHVSEKLYVNRLSLGLLGIILWLSLANFYSGVAFLQDSLSGALLGMLCAWHLIRLDAKSQVDANALMTSKIVWGMLLIACGVMAMFWPIPIFTYWLAIVFTMLGLLMILKQQDREMTGKKIVALIAILIAVNSLISFAAEQASISSVASLIVEAFRYPVLICVFVFSLRKSTNRNQSLA